jgi:hypothetical protein
MAELRCNECGHEFKGPAWYVAVTSNERGFLDWVFDTARGTRCPSCGSALIGQKR